MPVKSLKVSLPTDRNVVVALSVKMPPETCNDEPRLVVVALLPIIT